MKLLQVAPSLNRLYGGPVYSLVAFARAAQSVGIDVTIVGPHAPAKELEWIHSELPDVTILSFPTVGLDAFILSVPLLFWLRRHASEFDVLHIHGLLNPVSSLAATLAARMKIPFVVHPFGTLSRYTFSHRRSLLKRAYFRVLDGPNLRAAGAMHFTTLAERDESLWHSVEWGERAHIIPPPWIGGSVSPTTRPIDILAAEVLLMARLHPVKNVEGLVDAWPLVVKEIPHAHLTIAGDGKPDYVRQLKSRAAHQGLESRITFRGFVRAAEKTMLLASADVFVLPSYHENFGVVVLEALAAGIPVVLTPEVQVASFVIEHELGRVATRSPEPLARAIIDTVRDLILRARCRLLGPSLVQDHFAPAKLGALLELMYESAIRQTRYQSQTG